MSFGILYSYALYINACFYFMYAKIGCPIFYSDCTFYVVLLIRPLCPLYHMGISLLSNSNFLSSRFLLSLLSVQKKRQGQKINFIFCSSSLLTFYLYYLRCQIYSHKRFTVSCCFSNCGLFPPYSYILLHKCFLQSK